MENQTATTKPKTQAGLPPAPLLACPFCGGEAKKYTDGDGPVTGQAVHCVDCEARTEVNISKPREGVRRWQTRCFDGREYEWSNEGTRIVQANDKLRCKGTSAQNERDNQ